MASQTLTIGQIQQKLIIASEYWNHTEILLQKGCTYLVEVLPPNQYWADGRLFPQVATAEGFSNIVLAPFNRLKRMRTENWFTLCGCLDEEQKTSFKIGLKTTYTPDRDGELVCYANEAPNHYSNNRGQLFLTITRTK